MVKAAGPNRRSIRRWPRGSRVQVCRSGRGGHEKSRGPDLAHGSGSSGRRSCRLRSSSRWAQISQVHQRCRAQRIGGGASCSSFLAPPLRGDPCPRPASRTGVYARSRASVNRGDDRRRCPTVQAYQSRAHVDELQLIGNRVDDAFEVRWCAGWIGQTVCDVVDATVWPTRPWVKRGRGDVLCAERAEIEVGRRRGGQQERSDRQHDTSGHYVAERSQPGLIPDQLAVDGATVRRMRTASSGGWSSRPAPRLLAPPSLWIRTRRLTALGPARTLRP